MPLQSSSLTTVWWISLLKYRGRSSAQWQHWLWEVGKMILKIIVTGQAMHIKHKKNKRWNTLKKKKRKKSMFVICCCFLRPEGSGFSVSGKFRGHQWEGGQRSQAESCAHSKEVRRTRMGNLCRRIAQSDRKRDTERLWVSNPPSNTHNKHQSSTWLLT